MGDDSTTSQAEAPDRPFRHLHLALGDPVEVERFRRVPREHDLTEALQLVEHDHPDRACCAHEDWSDTLHFLLKGMQP